MPIDLRPILDHLPAWLLVFFRLTGVFVLAPVLGSSTVPRLVKALLAAGLAFCVYPTLLAPGSSAAPMIGRVVENGLTLWGLAGGILRELLIGFAVGYAASLPLMGMQVAGHMIGQQMGLAFATIVNPVFNTQSGVVDQFFFMTALALFTLLGGHHVMFAALIGSFYAIPLGGFDQFADLLNLMVGLLQVVFDMALRIAAPLLCLVFLITAAMGFVARTVPQMNILSVGFAIRIMAAGLFLALFIAAGSEIYINVTQQIFDTIMQFFTQRR
jgi:flagellar biosynthetic protein FliR